MAQIVRAGQHQSTPRRVVLAKRQIDPLGPELVVGGQFPINIDGFSARGASVIVHNETDGQAPGCLDCNITGVGGGFTTLLTREAIPGEVFRVSMDIKNISYVGGLKIKVGAGEAVIAAAITNEWVTYTVNDVAIALTDLFEFHRDGTIGSLLVDNVSVRKVLDPTIDIAGGTWTDTNLDNWVDENNVPWVQ